MKKLQKLILSVAILLLVGGAGYKLGERRALTTDPATTIRAIKNQEPPAGAAVDFGLFWDVWLRIHRYYIDSGHIDTQKLVWGAISGMVNALDDPYTIFLPPKENEEFKEDIGGSFQGIGAQLGIKDGRIIVVAPLSGSPAEKAGMKPMDWIMKVNDEETSGWTVTQAVAKIRGTKGTKVTLSILHENAQKPEDITITRDEIIVPSVVFWMKPVSEIKEISGLPLSIGSAGQKIAYIQLSRFGDRTNEEWLAAVDSVVGAIKTKAVKGVILDLRNNPGGYLDGSVFIASEFIRSGIVVTQTNSNGTKEDYQVNRKGSLYDVPLYVLINKGSASASEIVAGALRDYKRATIIGEVSYGKGSVQSPQELDGGAGLHITTGKWLLPKGDWINKKGITPDVEVKMDDYTATTDAQLAKAVEMALK